MRNRRAPNQKITLYLSTELLAKLEEAAKTNYCTRSDYIRSAVVQRLNRQSATPTNKQTNKQPASTQPATLARLSEAEFLKQLEERYG